MIVVTLGIGFKWQIDPEASRFERYLGIASIVVGIGITLVLTRRLSEMYFRGCFRSKSYAKDEKLSMSQKIISTVVSFIYYITHPPIIKSIVDRIRLKRVFLKRQKFGENRLCEYYEAKKTAIERILGPMDSVVGHALIPFCI